MSAVILDRDPRAATHPPRRPREQQVHRDPVPVPTVGLEQGKHPVVVDALAREREPDLAGEVEVADGHGVGVAERPLRGLGGGPGPGSTPAR